jgi:1,4-dihydroxy-2-naphthoate polyprenyltransferase
LNGAKVRAWIQASRPQFFVATLVPLGLGGVVAQAEGSWDTLRWIVVLLASFLVHLNTNLANDYYDYLSGADSGDSIGGSRVLQEGTITLGQLKTAMILLYGMAALLGIWIVWVSHVWWLLGAMLFAFFSSLFYTAPPVRYGYRGLGELFVGLNMGPVMVCGTAAALTGHFSIRVLWLSLPIGIMVALILYYQSLPDMEVDRSVGKRTVAVRLGRDYAIWGFRGFVAAGLLSIVALVVFGYVHPGALICILTLPLAIKIDMMIRSTEDWTELHDRGGLVRLFYLLNGLILIIKVSLFG